MRPGVRATATLDHRPARSGLLAPATHREDHVTATRVIPVIHEIHDRLVRIARAQRGRREAAAREPDQIDLHGLGTAHPHR
jgi:hypothetical protein